MRINFSASRRAGLSAALLLGASVISVTGSHRPAPAVADSPEAPIDVSAPVADAQLISGGSVPAILVTMAGATANATYVVSDCSMSAPAATSCVSDATLDVIKTDGGGNASATLLFDGATASDVVTIVSRANPNDAYAIYLTQIDPGV